MMSSFIFLFVGEDQTSSGETRNSNDEMESMRRERELTCMHRIPTLKVKKTIFNERGKDDGILLARS
jgi:hypothetical protein